VADKKEINVDIYSRHWYNNVRWIPYPVSKESPQLGYSIGLTDLLSLLHHSEVWLYDSNTKRVINLTNLNDYFPEYVPPWSKGSGGGSDPQKTYVVSDTTEGWSSKPTLVSEQDVLYIYTDYIITDVGDKIPGIKVGDGVTPVTQLPFTASSGGSSGEKEVYSKTTAEWDAQPTLIPKKDTLYVYTDYMTIDGVTIPGMKIGDGSTYLINLPYINTSGLTEIERTTLIDKVGVKPSEGDDDETLVFFDGLIGD
jgi:hypothetical protein